MTKSEEPIAEDQWPMTKNQRQEPSINHSFPRSPWECRLGRSASATYRRADDAERRGRDSHGVPCERVGRPSALGSRRSALGHWLSALGSRLLALGHWPLA